MTRTLICDATIINEGRQMQGSVLIEDSLVAGIYPQGTPFPAFLADELGRLRPGVERVEARGLWLLPGVIDTHVHFREPGLTHKADIASESMAAVAGGVTSFFDMPNTNPPTVTLASWQHKMDLACAKSRANYAFWLGATNDNLKEIAQADYSRVCGIKLFMGSSTGNMLVDDQQALEALFASAPAVVAAHCESEARIRANKARIQALYGEDAPVSCHPLIRDVQACYESSARAVELADKHGSRLHLLHLSTARELSLLSDAPLQQKRITAEVCPHYLWFCQDDYERLGSRIKCNPAIKTADDREALRQALNTRLVDVVSTDHAPHLSDEKQGGALRALSGFPSVQCSLLLMLELARQGVTTVENVVEKMCHAPARLFGIEGRGFVREGCKADLVLVDPLSDWQLEKADLLGKCGWSPYEGTRFRHRVLRTWVNGSLQYCQGEFSQGINSEPLRFSNVK
ncbi:MAG: dihydroorotase [Bacteroidales bacterium]|nr:dihydroorotase [Bacteroidales bacterium]